MPWLVHLFPSCVHRQAKAPAWRFLPSSDCCPEQAQPPKPFYSPKAKLSLDPASLLAKNTLCRPSWALERQSQTC